MKTLAIEGTISYQTLNSVVTFFNGLEKSDDVHILLNSTGGTVEPAFAMAAIIERESKQRKVEITCVGSICSAATYIAFCDTNRNRKEVTVDCEFGIHTITHTIDTRNFGTTDIKCRMKELAKTNRKLEEYYRSIVPADNFDEIAWKKGETLWLTNEILCNAIVYSIENPLEIYG